MTFYCGSRYIALPIRTGADSKTLLFYEGNKLIFDLTVSLDAAVQYTVPPETLANRIRPSI